MHRAVSWNSQKVPNRYSGFLTVDSPLDLAPHGVAVLDGYLVFPWKATLVVDRDGVTLYQDVCAGGVADKDWQRGDQGDAMPVFKACSLEEFNLERWNVAVSTGRRIGIPAALADGSKCVLVFIRLKGVLAQLS